MNPDRSARLRALPSVERILSLAGDSFRGDTGSFSGAPELSGGRLPKGLLVAACREAVEEYRRRVLAGEETPAAKPGMEAAVLALAKKYAAAALVPSLRRVVNGTGVVVHTNLGRSVLAEMAVENAARAAGAYSNLEYDLELGERGSRGSHVEGLLTELSGEEAAHVVNNNAAAVLLCLETLARGKKVIVSRGELVEIGGSFRIPEVMAKSGAVLCEVGATNRTHPRDYEAAIDENTGLLFKAHTSNFAVVGFTASVPLSELVRMGRERGIPVMEDLGSGSLLDLSVYGLSREPTVMDSVAAGADLVTFSGDKMLGGPQAGIIVGRKDLVAACRKNPLARAVRIDKMTLAALETTLRLYRDPETARAAIPTLRLLSTPSEELLRRARRLAGKIRKACGEGVKARVLPVGSRVGGGALPLESLQSFAVALEARGMSASGLEKKMRSAAVPVIGRIENGEFLLDVRTIADSEMLDVTSALQGALQVSPEASR